MKKLITILLTLSALCSFSQTSYSVNDKVSIEEKGKWYPGYIMQVDGEKYKIHYDGYGSNYDTWVTKDRLKSLGGSASSSSTNTQPTNGTYVVGQIVECFDGANWLEGEVFQVGGSGRYQVIQNGSYNWYYPKDMRATNKANANIEREKQAQQKKMEQEAKDKALVDGAKYKVGDKVVVPDRNYNTYTEATITEIRKDGYRVDNNPSTTYFESTLWLPWNGYKGFYEIADKLAALNYNVFGQLMEFQAGKSPNPQTIKATEIKDFLKQSDEIEKELKQKFPNPPKGGNCNQCPEFVMQTLAKKRDLIAEHYLENPAKRAEEYFVGMTKTKIEDLKRGSNNMHVADSWLGAKNPDAELEKSYQEFYKTDLKPLEEYYTTLNFPVPSINKNELFGKVKALAPEYETELLKVDWVAKSSDPFSTKDATLEPMVRQYITKIDPKATISKIGFAAGNWEKYESTTYYVAGRAKYAWVWVTNPEYKYKYIYQLKISQEYFGGGKYGKTNIDPQALQWFFYSK